MTCNRPVESTLNGIFDRVGSTRWLLALALSTGVSMLFAQPATQPIDPPRSESAVATADGGTGAPPSTRADPWPLTISGAGAAVVLYSPQPVAWRDRRTLDTRIAIGVTPAGSERETLGTAEVSFATDADLNARTVAISSPRTASIHPPAGSRADTERFEQAAREAIEAMGTKRITLDLLLQAFADQAMQSSPVEVRNDPPLIFYSARPASLLVFDGEPILAPIGTSTLSVAVNTNWDVFVDAGSKAWYWLCNGAWLTATDYKGPWTPAKALPDAFSSLPDNRNFSLVRKQIPGKTIPATDVPAAFVSTQPAEIIVTTGAPRLITVAGTALRYVGNTESNVFVHVPTGKYYYLVAGRWFVAPALTGPWTFATAELPADFARIPPRSRPGVALVSVPGTPQAREAVLQAQVPTQGSLDRASTRLDVAYAGEPTFEPIAGTGLSYAVNTLDDVIRSGERYYACRNAAWFVASSPTGAWTLADDMPAALYAIPASHPLHRVTYVRVLAATPASVTFGYTGGYAMSYAGAGVLVHGTGYRYPPTVRRGVPPIYIPYPYTYPGHVWYNANVGAWMRSGTLYDPQAAEAGGGAYNAPVGAQGRGSAAYGPNGGAGAWSAYDPSLGGYVQASVSWSPRSGIANAGWFNGRSGVAPSVNQSYNRYANWPTSNVAAANRALARQRQVDAQKKAEARAEARAEAARSGDLTEAMGPRGPRAFEAAATRGVGHNVYAGADGNVYRYTNGWSRWNAGAWVPVPDDAKAGDRTFAALESDRNARATASERQRLLEAAQSAHGSRQEIRFR
jgi:hypothetical protein